MLFDDMPDDDGTNADGGTPTTPTDDTDDKDGESTGETM
jgi:hypothetical protein